MTRKTCVAALILLSGLGAAAADPLSTETQAVQGVIVYSGKYGGKVFVRYEPPRGEEPRTDGLQLAAISIEGKPNQTTADLVKWISTEKNPMVELTKDAKRFGAVVTAKFYAGK